MDISVNVVVAMCTAQHVSVLALFTADLSRKVFAESMNIQFLHILTVKIVVELFEISMVVI